MFGIKISKFDKLLEKATSELLLEPEWDINLQISDLVRGQEVSPKYAISGIKRKIHSDNPHVVMLALSLLESLMKNCGTPMHDEVAGTEFVTDLLEFTHSTEEIRTKIFNLIQNWEFAFAKNQNYHSLHNAFNEIKRSGFPLPPFTESEAMFAANVAPGWRDGDVCFRCRSSFTTFRRKHHCRKCGNIFCADCTSGRALLPEFGIEKEVRVCDLCLQVINGQCSSAAEHTLTHVSNADAAKAKKHSADEAAARDRELQLTEEEELQLALALSASEAESKKKVGMTSQTKGGESTMKPSKAPPTPSIPTTTLVNGGETEVDDELAFYLNRNYWATRATNSLETDSVSLPLSTLPTAPIFHPPTNPNYIPSIPDTSIRNANVFPVAEMPTEGQYFPGVPPLTTEKKEEFLNALRKSVDVFLNRMRVNSQRGRPIVGDATIQSLFHALHAMHPQLLQYSSELEHRRVYLEQLQDTTTQLHEAREALDALRREHAERRRLEEAEAHRLRHIQMMQKVELLRQQKQNAIEAQRRIALEQTLQYQQHFQYQQLQPYAVDQSSGLAPPGMHTAVDVPGGMIYSVPPTNYSGMEYAYAPHPSQFSDSHFGYSVAGAPQPPESVDQVAISGEPPKKVQQPTQLLYQPVNKADTDTNFNLQTMVHALPQPHPQSVSQSHPESSFIPPATESETPVGDKKSLSEAQLICFD